MSPLIPPNQSRPAFFMLALLLVTLWVSAAHLHGADDPHPQTQCTVCVQLQSAHFASGNGTQVSLLSTSDTLVNGFTSPGVDTATHSRYQSRAPPTASS